jgi:hypothetical protein
VIARAWSFNLLKDGGGIVAFAGEEAEENTYRGDPSRDGLRGAAAAALTVQVGDIIVRAGGGEGQAAIVQEGFETLEVAAIGEQRIAGQPAFRRQVEEEPPQKRAAAGRVNR